MWNLLCYFAPQLWYSAAICWHSLKTWLAFSPCALFVPVIFSISFLISEELLIFHCLVLNLEASTCSAHFYFILLQIEFNIFWNIILCSLSFEAVAILLVFQTLLTQRINLSGQCAHEPTCELTSRPECSHWTGEFYLSRNKCIMSHSTCWDSSNSALCITCMQYPSIVWTWAKCKQSLSLKFISYTFLLLDKKRNLNCTVCLAVTHGKAGSWLQQFSESQ